MLASWSQWRKTKLLQQATDSKKARDDARKLIFSKMKSPSASHRVLAPFGWVQSWVCYTPTVTAVDVECMHICKPSFHEGSIHTCP